VGAAGGVLLVGVGVLAIIMLGAKMASGQTGSSAGTAGTGGSTGAASSSAPSAGGTGTVVGLVTWADINAIGAAHGWTQAQINDWASVIKSESNGTLTDTNPSSGAYGIAQFINGSGEYAQYGGDAHTLTGQLTAMANYIAQRYHDPSAAWTFHQANNWY
jgi:hypothetical protein